MYGSWNTDISGTSVDSGAVVTGEKSTVPSWTCCATSRSPPSAPEWWWMILTLPAVSSATLSANCCAASVVPCLAGLTLPIVSSRVCAPATVHASASDTITIAPHTARFIEALLCSAIGIGGLADGRPEDRIVTGEDPAARQPRQRLQPLDRVHGQGRVPHDAGRALLVDVLLPIAAVAGEDDRARLRQLHEQRLVARRMAVGAQHGDARHQLGVAVEQAPAVLRQVEVLAVVESLEERGGVVRVGVLVL